MINVKSWFVKVLATTLVAIGFSAGAAWAADPVKAEYPVLVTSFGQAPDGNTISVLAKRLGSTVTYETLAPADRVKDFKTIIVSLGVSLKGFGAAGVNLDTEIARAAAILKEAKEKGIKVIAVHIGGEGRRDQMSNKIIETYGDKFDTIVVYKDGNKDSLFTTLAKKNDTPFVEVEKLSQVSDALKTILK